MMRIVIDLQGAQSSGSRNRGIGRYTLSLAQAIVRNKGEHEVIIALNGLFADTIEPIRAAFGELLPQENIRVWNAPGPVCHLAQENNWRRKAAELVREAFLASLQPDMVYVTSLFEGLSDDAVTSVGLFTQSIPTAVTLYDLIPLINRTPYLDNPVVESWYENKLDQLRRASLLLAISESSRQEGIEYLGFPCDMAINVGTAADAQFQCVDISATTERSVRERYGLAQQFVMYTGGVDHRKNIEGLIRAFALLPKTLRTNHQLAIVCSVQPESRRQLEELAKQQGLAASEVVLTGFVPEEDLIALYHLCKAFVFPSWHEGFGLPALEAMSCGAAVIGANTSSLPEVIGREDALFDPFDDKAIANKLNQVLTDSAYRAELIRHGLEQAKKFSWDECAQLAITAFEQFHAKSSKSQQTALLSSHRPRLAFVSPLPPERSGIADYSAELLPELARHYHIDVIIAQEAITDPWVKENCSVRNEAWFVSHAHFYDRVLYHFGNSHYHQHMFDLLNRIPGVVVLHDFFLSGITAYMANQKWVAGIVGAWEAALYNSHGYAALVDFAANRDVQEAANKYPCNKGVLESAQGIIVHSENSRRLARQWVGEDVAKDWAVIPLMRVKAASSVKRNEAREALGLDTDAFLICSFGLLAPTKQNARLLKAWLASSLKNDKRCHLYFVGENHSGDYGKELTATIQSSGLSDRIRITGWTDTEQFRQYLAAADLGIQLRTLSRGETSAAVLDCMNYGLPTIVNANGSMADLPNDAVFMMPDEFEDADLLEALELLWKDDRRRHALGERAREVISTYHNPRSCADQYAQAIESFYERTQTGKEGLINAIARIECALPPDEEAWVRLAEDIASNYHSSAIRQLLVDVSELMHRDANDVTQFQVRSILAELLANPPMGYRVEPIFAVPNEPGYRYARKFTLQFLGSPSQALVDDPVAAFNGDVFLGMDLEPYAVEQRTAFCQHLRHIGVPVYFVVCDLLPDISEGAIHIRNAWLDTLVHADGVVCMSCVLADQLSEWLAVFGSSRFRPLKLGWFPKVADKAGSASARSGVDAGKEFYSDAVPSLTWKEGTQNLLDVLLGEQWYQQWMPDEVWRFWGGDSRLGTQVGERRGTDIVSTGQTGYLIFGPYISLVAGSYQVQIHGEIAATGAAGARMDVAVEQGSIILGESVLDNAIREGSIVTLPITLDKPCTDLEIRIWVNEASQLRVSLIEIVPWQGDSIELQQSAQALAIAAAAIEHAKEEVEVSTVELADELAEYPVVVEAPCVPQVAVVQTESQFVSAQRNSTKAKRKKRR